MTRKPFYICSTWACERFKAHKVALLFNHTPVKLESYL